MFSDLVQIFQRSVAAVIPKKLIRHAIKFNPQNESLACCGRNYNLKNRNVFVVGFGKAVQYMAKETENILGSKIKGGIISIPYNSLQSDYKSEKLKYIEGAKYNLPDESAKYAAEEIMKLANSLKENDFLIVLISGGGSALLPLPENPITLEEKTVLIKQLANAGADITELNTVRKKLSKIKGGKLALEAQPADVISLILSDIVKDPLDLIASGPTVEDLDNVQKAINVINKYNLSLKLPLSVKTVLSEQQNTVRWPSDKVFNFIIGSNKMSIAAAVQEAQMLGYTSLALSSTVTGNIKLVAEEYVTVAKMICDLMKGKISNNEAYTTYKEIKIEGLYTGFFTDSLDFTKENRICLILGGEITIEVKGSGLGGRNQQLPLEISYALHQKRSYFDGYNIHFLSAGTDGIDGPTDAAGGIGFMGLIDEAKNDNLNVLQFIDDNDSYNFYKIFKNGRYHVTTGHTNTNVMDIHLILITRNK